LTNVTEKHIFSHSSEIFLVEEKCLLHFRCTITSAELFNDNKKKGECVFSLIDLNGEVLVVETLELTALLLL